jgi:uncharacterized protein YndB with AHSA1/START domain
MLASQNIAESDREIVTSRVLDAPREVVFEAWSSPLHLARWWGPNGFKTTTHAFAFRPGGTWRHTMHGPDGTDFPNRIVYDEIVAPKRIAYSHHGGIDGVPAQFQSTVTFDDEKGKTRITMRAVFSTAAERDAVVKKYGAVEGAKQTLGRLADHVASGEKPLELIMSRTFDAPRRLVFDAWSKAENLSQWFTPRPLTTSACQLDFRPGGIFRIVMRMPNGDEHVSDGKFVEVVDLERIVFSGKLADGNQIDTTVTFSDEGERTMLHVRQTYSFASPATSGAPQGWTATLDQLGEFLERG